MQVLPPSSTGGPSRLFIMQSKQVGLSFPMHIGRHAKKSCSHISAFLFLILLSYPLLPQLILLVFSFIIAHFLTKSNGNVQFQQKSTV